MASQVQMPQLDEASQKELASFIEREQASAKQRMKIQELTGQCWEKCVTGINTRFSRGEESCLLNCVDRFLDTSMFIIRRLENQMR